MTEKVNPSELRPIEAFKTAEAIANGGHGSGFIVDGASPTESATQDTSIDETALNEFAESHSASSFDVTIDPGEAYVAGAWVVTDTSTTVTISSSSTETVYVGWNKDGTDDTIVGTQSAFDSASGNTDQKIALYDFTTDGSGVTSVTDNRYIGYTQEETTFTGSVYHDQNPVSEISRLDLSNDSFLDAGDSWRFDISTDALNFGYYDDSDGQVTGTVDDIYEVRWNENDVDKLILEQTELDLNGQDIINTGATSGVKALDGFFVDLDVDDNSTTETFTVSRHNESTDLFTVGESGSVTVESGSFQIPDGQDIQLGPNGSYLSPNGGAGGTSSWVTNSQSVRIFDNANGYPLQVWNEGGPVEIQNSALELDVGQSINDGSGNKRMELFASDTTIYGENPSGTYLRIDDSGFGVILNDADLEIDTGNSIRDSTGTDRIDFDVSGIQINNDVGDRVFSAGDGQRVQVLSRTDEPFVIRDASGTYDGVRYNSSATAPGELVLLNSNLNIPDDRVSYYGTGNDFSIQYESSSDELLISDDAVDLIRQPKAGPTKFVQGIDAGSIEAPEDSYTQILNSLSTPSATSGDTIGYTFAVDNQTALSIEGDADGSGGIQNDTYGPRIDASSAGSMKLPDRQNDNNREVGEFWYRSDLD